MEPEEIVSVYANVNMLYHLRCTSPVPETHKVFTWSLQTTHYTITHSCVEFGILTLTQCVFLRSCLPRRNLAATQNHLLKVGCRGLGRPLWNIKERQLHELEVSCLQFDILIYFPSSDSFVS